MLPSSLSDASQTWISQVIIRLVQKIDLPALEWDGEYTHYRRLYADIYQSSCNGKTLMWMAELTEGRPIGQLFVQLNSARPDLADGKKRAYIYGFRVKPEYRGRGVGKRMLLVAETDLAQRHFHLVCLNVAQDNPAARRLYMQLGYRQVGTDPGIWSYIDDRGILRDVHEPAWRMEKQITAFDQN